MDYQEVFKAVKQGDADSVLSMVEADPQVLHLTNSNQITPLTIAFAYGHLELALRLIERGANVFAMNHSDKWGMRYITEKHGLSQQERERFVQAAITAHVWDEEIFHAVWRRDVDEAKAILASKPKTTSLRLANANGESGFYNLLPYCGLTPLHYAVIAGDEPMVQMLLSHNAEVDAIPHGHKPNSRHTPIYFTPEGCDSIAQLLVEHGADVNHTTLYLSEGSTSMRKVVVANGAGGTPLMAALAVGRLDEAASIIRADPSVINDRLPNSRLNTPLHMAVKADSRNLVQLLVDSGMEIDTPTSRGYTALALAPETYCSLEMIELLVNLGADVRVGDDSPVYAAVWQHAYGHWNYESIIRLLVQHGSKPRGLCDCVQAGNLAAVELLLELGADVNETDEMSFYRKLSNAKGYTALDYCTGVAGKDKHPEIEKLLRKHGAG